MPQDSDRFDALLDAMLSKPGPDSPEQSPEPEADLEDGEDD